MGDSSCRRNSEGACRHRRQWSVGKPQAVATRQQTMHRLGRAGFFFWCDRCALTKLAYHSPTGFVDNKNQTLRVWLSACFYWCLRSESNQHLMITNQLHDLHATEAATAAEAVIIAESESSARR